MGLSPTWCYIFPWIGCLRILLYSPYLILHLRWTVWEFPWRSMEVPDNYAFVRLSAGRMTSLYLIAQQLAQITKGFVASILLLLL